MSIGENIKLETLMETMLFSPITLRNVRLKNRIVLSPMLTYSAVDGNLNEWHLMHLGKYAAGGCGLVFMESTKVDPRGCTTPADLGLWDDRFIPPMKRIADFIKQHGAVPGIQLSHSGRKARHSRPWEGRGPLEEVPEMPGGGKWELVAPSAIPHEPGHPVPRALSRDEIAGLARAWGLAADRAHRAGFEVIEIHAAHGYLIHEFLSPVANQRTDEYGGSLENRMRFAVEVAAETRRCWPEDKPLFMRLSSVDDSGWTIEDSVELAKRLKAVGVDVIDCSSGGLSNADHVATSPTIGYGYQVPHAERIRAGAGIKTMAVGHIIHADQAEAILRDGRADLVAIGRELLHNPNWPIDAAQKLKVETAFSNVPDPYGYWLEKRAKSRFPGRPSTWQAGIEAQSVPTVRN
jgi:2,4-dienoyl-CoA reductase-like NADH-dependent reductase (Old Yellow Enzyme family)